MIDRKGSNGKGTKRIESGGDLSTTVQDAKHTAAFISQLTAEYSGRSSASDQSEVRQFSEHNVQQARSGSKSLRGKSKAAGVTNKKTGLAAKSEGAQYVSDEAARYLAGGKKIKG